MKKTYRYKMEEEYKGSGYVHWKGWAADIKFLREKGWKITIITNFYNDKRYFYVRDPITKLIGRGKIETIIGIPLNNLCITLDYFCHERNARIRKYTIEPEDKESVKITKENISQILGYVAELQQSDLKLRHKKPVEILELFKEIA